MSPWKSVFAFALGFGLLAAIGTGTANAAPGTTTVVLSCDRLVGTASATVELRTSIFDPTFETVNLSCGPDSTSGLKTERVKVTSGSAGFAAYSISVTNIVGSGGCVGGTVTAASIPCDPNSGAGVKLVVR